MTAPAYDCGIVPSIETTVAVDLYMGTLQYDALAGDNQNKSILLGMTIQMILLEVWVNI